MNLPSLLAQLEQGQLIRQALESEAAAFGGAYEFEHALAQDSAYQSLLRARRRAIHRRVAECFERLYPDRLDEIAGLLARHFAEAGDDARALDYAVRAGESALGKYALAEAIAHYDQGLELAQQLHSRHYVGRLYGQRGRALELMGRHEQALRNYEQMLAAGAEYGERRLELQALIHQTLLRSTANFLFDPDQAERLASAALALAFELDDGPGQARILWSQVNLNRFTNRNQDALPLGERAIAIIRQQLAAGPQPPDRDLLELEAYVLNDVSHVYTWTGHPDQAAVSLRQATELWRQLDNRAMLADNLATAGLYLSLFGDVEAARAAAAEGMRISDAIHNPWGQSYTRSAASILHWHAGEMSQARRIMQDSVRFGQEGGYLVAQALMRAYLALLHMDLGAIKPGLAIARTGLAAAEQHLPVLIPALRAALAYLLLANGEQEAAQTAVHDLDSQDSDNPFVLDLVMGARAVVLLAAGAVAEALDASSRHVDYLTRYRFSLLLPMARHEHARALLAAGQTEAARAALAEALRQAEAMEVRREAWRILATWAALEATAGNHAEAATLRGRCRNYVDFIAGQIEEAELRETFLAQVEERVNGLP